MNITDEDIYNEILEDNARGILIHQQAEAIMRNPKSAYYDTNHIDHGREVRKVEMLFEFKHGNEEYAPEVMPIVTQTDEEPNGFQADADFNY